MPNININTGAVSLTVNDDPARVIRFNPTDVNFAERVYQLIEDVQVKEKEMTVRSKDIDKRDTLTADGLSALINERIALAKESCVYLRAEIDRVFGQGTAQAAFEDANDLGDVDEETGQIIRQSMFMQFFDGILPYFKKSREAKINQYTTQATVKRGKPRQRKTK